MELECIHKTSFLIPADPIQTKIASKEDTLIPYLSTATC